MTHTPEPWEATDCASDPKTPGSFALYKQIESADFTKGEAIECIHLGDFWADAPDISDDERLANRDRIVACVNACAGLNPAAVPGLVAALERLVQAEAGAVMRSEAVGETGLSASFTAARAALASARGGAG